MLRGRFGHKGEEDSAMSREYPERPIVGVGAVVLRAGEVLLIRRGKPPREGLWSLPGGAQEVGETVFEAARREVREETGVDVEVLGIVDVVDSIDRDRAGGVRQHYTLVDVFAAWREGEPKAGFDAAEAAWIPLDRLRALGLWSETERIIRLGVEMWEALGRPVRAPGGERG
jgi:ADP-ribose pyrophosphatase YjhB (NUDIX family)